MRSIRMVLCLTGVLLLCVTILSPGRARAETAKPFRVGVIIPLTGDLADYGVSIRRGFELAVSQSPEQFNNIDFIFEDSQYDANTAVTALQKLRTSDDVDLLYAWGVSPTEAVIPIAESNKLPLIVETTLKESTANKKFVVRAARTGERIAQALAHEIEERKIKKVSLIVADIPFYDDIVKHLKLLLPGKGITITQVKSVLPSENDVRPYVLELKKQNEGAIGVFLLPGQLVSFYRRLAELKLVLQTFSADIIGSESIIRDCPDSVNGTFFTEVGVTPEFEKLYSERFGRDGHIGHAAQAYDVATIVRDLFGKLAGKPTGDQIVEAISTLAPRSASTGALAFSETPDGGKELRTPVAMKIIRNKQIETIVQDTTF